MRLIIMTALFITTVGLAGCPYPPQDVACVHDTDCDKGQQCANGTCGASDGGACNKDADCGANQTCNDDGTCCDVQGGEGEGEGECSRDSDCADGKVCNDAGKCVTAGGNGGDVRTVEVCLGYSHAFDHRLMLRSDEDSTFPPGSAADRDDPTVFDSTEACDDIEVRVVGFLQINDALDGGGDANYAAINVNDQRCGIYGDATGQVGELTSVTVDGQEVLGVAESVPQECDGDINCQDTDPVQGCDILVDLREVL